MVGLETTAVQGGGLDVSIFHTMEWVDWTAVIVLSIFFILGLFRGFVWQASRILSLIAGFVVAGIYGEWGAELIHPWFKPETSLHDIPLYLSYVAIFLGVIVLLSLITHFVQKLIKKSGLSFYDRIGGGFLGMATGACVMIAFLGMLYMFIPEDWGIVKAAHESKSMQFTQKTLRVLGNAVPRPMQQVFGVDDGDPHGAGDKKKKTRTDLNQKVPPTPKKKRKRGL